MSVEYHPAVAQDVAEALRRYDAVSQQLGEEFKAELRRLIAVARSASGQIPSDQTRPPPREPQTLSLPLHLRERPGGIRVILVRHHRRHPDHGMERE